MKFIQNILYICVVCMLCAPMPLSAQLFDEWHAFPGTAPVDTQLEVLEWLKQMKSEKNTDKYIFSEAMSDLCFSLGEAEEQAMAMGRIGLISALDNEYQLTSEVDELTGHLVENAGFRYGDYTFDMTTRNTERYEFVSSRYVVKYNDATLYETIIEGDKDVLVKTYWDAVVRNSDRDPLLRTAWCVLKFYCRKASRYQVKVVMCNYY